MVKRPQKVTTSVDGLKIVRIKLLNLKLHGEEAKSQYFIKDCYKGPLLSQKFQKIDIKYIDFQSYERI